MATLFVIGNIRQFTFANAIVAADLASRARYGEGLDQVLVFHSPESRTALSERTEWSEFLRRHSVHPERLVEVTLDLAGAGEQEAVQITERHVTRCVRSLRSTEPLYIDLTNGDSFYKNLFSTLSFLLGVKHPFVLVAERLVDAGLADDGKKDRRRDLAGRFWTEAELRTAYRELPDPARLDEVGPEWWTEVRRFDRRAKDRGARLAQLLDETSFEPDQFEADLRNAVRSWFEGARAEDGAALGSAVRSVGRAFEHLIGATGSALRLESKGKSFRVQVARIAQAVKLVAPDLEPKLLVDMANLLWDLRNVSTHEGTSATFGKIRASLSTELLFAVADYFDFLGKARLDRAAGVDNQKLQETQGSLEKVKMSGVAGEVYYFGLDGDDTGLELERLFLTEENPAGFTEFSKRVEAAVARVVERIPRTPLRGKVLFNAGDDLLFRARFDEEAIEELRETYREASGGLTCSVGYGPTPRSAYVALKIAKARPGKNATTGVVLEAP